MAPLFNSDAWLVGQTLRGNREAFGRLADRHMSTAYAVALATLRNPVYAEDVVQEAFVKAYTKLDTLREPAKFLPWLIAIVRRECSASFRVTNRERALHSEEVVGAEDPTITARDRARVLQEAMEGLDDTSREALTLHYFAGKRVREIAVALDITPNAVKKRLERGRTSLGKQLQAVTKTDNDEKSLRTLKAELLSAIALIAPAWRAEAAVGGAVVTGSTVTWTAAGFAAAAAIGVIAIMPWQDSSSTSSPSSTVLAAENGPVASVDAEDDPDTETPTAAIEQSAATEKKDADGPEPDDDSEPEAEIEDVLASPVSITFENEHIGPIMDYLSQYLDVPFVVDWRVVPITSDLADAFPEGFGNQVPAQVRGEEDEWDWPPAKDLAYVTDGMIDYVNIRDSTLAQSLQVLLDELNLVYFADENFLIITSQEKFNEDFADRELDSVAMQRMEQKLGSPLSITFEDEHIEAIFAFVSEYLDVNVALDYRVIQPREPTSQQFLKAEDFERQRKKSIAEGVVSYIDVKEVSVEAILDMLTTTMDMAYEVRDGYVFISTDGQIEADRQSWADNRWLAGGASEEWIAFLQSPIGDHFGSSKGESISFAKSIQETLNSVQWPYSSALEIDLLFPDPGLNRVDEEVQRHFEAQQKERATGLLPPVPTNTPVHAFLDIVTRPMHLKWFVRDNKLVVTYVVVDGISG